MDIVDLSVTPRAADTAAWVSASSYLWPAHLIDSAWHEHAAFLSWLIDAQRPRVFVELGTHNGYSFFAACDAITRHDVPATAHAVDTWVGDDQAGFYDEGVFESVQRVNAEYASFTTLHRMTFDQALDAFDDHTVDLLHIDGRHGYDDVRHDFESWVPKMSARGVVIMHDVAERKDGFGVWQFWEELAERYPTFAFEHNHGLGVVGVGSRLDPSTVGFFEAAETAGDEIRETYARIGGEIEREYQQRLALAQLVEQAERRLADIEAECRNLEQRLATVQGSTSWRVTAPARWLTGLVKR
jgi:hypothetical protein